MKTGNTLQADLDRAPHRLASMEPGHEDREYAGLDDGQTSCGRLNGARS